MRLLVRSARKKNRCRCWCPMGANQLSLSSRKPILKVRAGGNLRADPALAFATEQKSVYTRPSCFTHSCTGCGVADRQATAAFPRKTSEHRLWRLRCKSEGSTSLRLARRLHAWRGARYARRALHKLPSKTLASRTSPPGHARLYAVICLGSDFCLAMRASRTAR